MICVGSHFPLTTSSHKQPYNNDQIALCKKTEVLVRTRGLFGYKIKPK